jgi:dCMP deaminase
MAGFAEGNMMRRVEYPKSEPTELDYLRMAYEAARDNSEDPSTQNGAVIVSGNSIISTGWNHIPLGVKGTWERPAKYLYVEHAERDSIYTAARHGKCTLGATMYCPWFACADCARGIICSGIKNVVGLRRALDLTPPHWIENVEAANRMLTDGGVDIRWIDDRVGVTIRFNGNLEEM